MEEDDLPLLFGPDGQPITGIKHVWRPSPELAEHLPAGFGFAMRCVVNPDGLRRFYRHFDALIADAFQGGLAILTVRGLSRLERQSCRGLYLLFKRLLRTREHFGNDLLNANSLTISRSGRDLADERTILPESLGRNSQDEGETWSVIRLLREGREAARGAGIQRPSHADQVHYGLLAAARRNPLYVPDAEASSLVRSALYESISERPEPELVRLVIQRTLTAMHRHLDEPSAAFDRWFLGPKNSLIQQIAQQKRRPGGTLDPIRVRRALQDTGWEAYAVITNCIDVQMRLFERLLPEPLSPAERRWFEQMHLSQPYFGNLPLALLVERFPLVKSVIWEIWEKPGDREPVAVMHRLLAFYGEMASARRATDRRVQQRRSGQGQSGGPVPLTVPLKADTPTDGDDREDGADDLSADPEPFTGPREVDQPDFADTGLAGGRSVMSSGRSDRDLFLDIADLIREQRQVRCSCVIPDWDARLPRKTNSDATIEHTCRSCGFTVETTLSLEQFTSLAFQVRQ